MLFCEIAVPILEGLPFTAQLDAALQLARQAPPVPAPCIKAVFIPSSPQHVDSEEMTLSISDLVADDDITFEDGDSEIGADEVLAKAKFDAWRTAHNLVPGRDREPAGGIRANWHHSINALEAEIIATGRLSDLIVLGRPTQETSARRAFEVAVLETGRPALFVPQEIPENLLGHVVVAWDGSLQATRAIAAAMPLLQKAARVSIFSASDPAEVAVGGPDIRDHFTRHGVHAGRLQSVAERGPIGAALLRVAAYEAATMLVMGAYGDSHVREMLFDGVTRHVIRHSATSVLMVH